MTEELLLKVAALKVISAYTAERYEDARAEIAKVLNRGDKLVARSPLDGTKIGPVYKTDPKSTASVRDEPALLGWLSEHYPSSVDTGYEVSGTTDQVVAVLFEHAPHLLRDRRRIKPEVVADIRRSSAALGHPVGPGGEADVPGIEVSTPDAVVACKPDDMALVAVLDLFHAGRLELDGSSVPELPEAAA